jgi:hypothetical protein
MPAPSDTTPIVLIDARNVIRSRWPNLNVERFVELAREWGEREEKQLFLVFDGQPGAGRDIVDDDRSRIVGTGEESADDWIVREAERLSRDGRRLWLVSSDRELRGRVTPFVEHVVGGGGFATLLESLDRGRDVAD